jgi:hypothetical protein
MRRNMWRLVWCANKTEHLTRSKRVCCNLYQFLKGRVSQPHFGQVWGWSPTLGKVGGWESFGTPESCSARRDLSNTMSHAQIGRREEVDSRLLVVGSQTAGPSFAHNLGCRCPNCQCEGIFDIYVSRPFQWHQEHPNARCFAPCCRALNIRESRKTPNLQLFQVLGFTPTLGQSGVAT